MPGDHTFSGCPQPDASSLRFLLPLATSSSVVVDELLVNLKRQGLLKDRSRNFRRLPLGWFKNFAPISVDRNDPDTLCRGFAKRLGRNLPNASRSLYRELSCFVDKWLSQHLSPLKKDYLDQASFEEWLSLTNYNEARKDELRKARESTRGRLPPERACSKVKSFIKLESYPEVKEARWINSRVDIFKVWSGPIFKAIENEVYKYPAFIKHTPVPDRPKKIASLIHTGCHYYSTDYTAFESHFTKKLMNACELRLYRYMMGNSKASPFICNVISGINRLRTRSGLAFELEARRMSGDMCTSLGNGFTNLMLALFLAYKKKGHLEGFVEGDDGIFATDVELTAKDYEELGMTIKIVNVDTPLKASFCGMLCSPDLNVIKDPVGVISSFGWTSSFIQANDNIMWSLLKSKSLSLCYEMPQCPILGILGRTCLREANKQHIKEVKQAYDGYHELVPSDYDVPEFNPSLSTRLFFEQQFNISVSTQYVIEGMIDQLQMDRAALLIPSSKDLTWYADKYVI